MTDSESEVQEIGGEISSPTNVRKKRSFVYGHFDFKEQTGDFNCKICRWVKFYFNLQWRLIFSIFFRAKYPKKSDGSTSALVKHLRSTHPILFNSKNTTLDGFVKTGNSKDIEKSEPFTAAGLRKRIVEFIVLENQPFQLAEKSSFQNLIKYCNEQATFPCANTIRADIEKLYLEKKIELKCELMVHIYRNNCIFKKMLWHAYKYWRIYVCWRLYLFWLYRKLTAKSLL